MYTLLASENLMQKTTYFWALMKFRLSALVVFSGAFGYLLAANGPIDWWQLSCLLLGSLLVTGAANTINQIIEKDLDRLMRRTANRPLPTGMLQVREAAVFATVLAIAGTGLLAVYVNVLAASLSLLSLILYAFVYTPLKQITPISVLVGAFPGALPPLIGWVAYTGTLSAEAVILFGIQFFWQFPHFWAIAWVGSEDYQKAGFKMLPNGAKDVGTATQMMIYSLFLLPLCMLPLQIGLTGVVSAIIAGVATVLFIGATVRLVWLQTNQAALGVMFSSFFYLPILQLAFLFDKI